MRAEDACAIRCPRSRRCWRGTRCAFDLWLSARTPRSPSIRIQRMRTTSMDGPERHFWRSKFVIEERYVTPHARRWLCISATVLIVLGVLCFTVILIGVLSHSGMASWDKLFAQWMCTHRPPRCDRSDYRADDHIRAGGTSHHHLRRHRYLGRLRKLAWRPLILASAIISGVVVANSLAQIVHRRGPRLVLCSSGTTPRSPSRRGLSSARATSSSSRLFSLCPADPGHGAWRSGWALTGCASRSTRPRTSHANRGDYEPKCGPPTTGSSNMPLNRIV